MPVVAVMSVLDVVLCSVGKLYSVYNRKRGDVSKCIPYGRLSDFSVWFLIVYLQIF